MGPISQKCSAHLIIEGRVQGVGYRYFAQAAAQALGLTGWVRNLPDGDVECEVEGDRPTIEQWLERLRQGPPLAHIEFIHVNWMPDQNRYVDFTIRF